MALQLSNLFSGGKDTGVSGTGRRAFYAMVSRNTSSTWAGAALYDRSLVGSLFNTGDMSSYQPYTQSHIVFNTNSTYQYRDQIWGPVSGTESNPASSGTDGWINGTNAAGEFGNASIDVYSDGTISNIYSRYVSGTVKHYLNACAINSDHSNKRMVYILYSGVIRAVDRLYGSYHVPMAGTSDFTVPSLSGSMQGSASYHTGRKELTIISYVTSSGSFNCFTYQNVDFNLYPDPYIALNRPEVVRVDATLSLASNWGTNNSESYYNLKPVTTDNGNVYVTVMFTSSNFTLYRFTRSGTSAITGTYVTQQSLTTSYGLDSGTAYGQRTITSRDGTTVLTFCPYYYYGSGIRSFMIDKTNNTYTVYGNSNTSYGLQPVPYGDNGWTYYYCGNGYAGNYPGSYILSVYGRAPGGGHFVTNSQKYFPYFTGPNTTNYPGYNQVVDYALLQDNPSGPK